MNSAVPLLRHNFCKNILMISVAWWFAVLLGSGARGSLLAQFLGILVLLAFFGRKAFPIGRIWLIAFGWGVVLYLVFIVFLPLAVFPTTESYSVLRSGTSGRLQLWAYALDLSARNFPFGAGPLSYTRETPITGFGTPHSLYFRWAAEYGWLFLCLFIAAMLCIGAPSWLRFRKEPTDPSDLFHIAIFWSVLAAFIHAGVSGVFTSPYSLLVGLPILSVYFGHLLKDRLSKESNHPKLSSVFYLSAVLFGISIALISPMHDWYEGAKGDQNRYAEEYHQPLAPRFWLNGRYTGEKFKNQEITR